MSVDEGSSSSRSKADRLVAIARAKSEFAQTKQGAAYAKIKVGDHCEVYSVESKFFKKWLTGEFYKLTKSGVAEVRSMKPSPR